MAFVLLFGIVSLFSDMTHEGASSIRGAYLTLLGASAGTIGFISGLRELVGYSMRYVFGKLTDKTKHYWTMTIVGYVLDVLAVPALALVGEHGWVWACALLVIQRMGKAIKKPAKDTILSFAASQEGVGKSFGIQEVLDQIGAFLGFGAAVSGDALQNGRHNVSGLFHVLCSAGYSGRDYARAVARDEAEIPESSTLSPSRKEYVPFKLKKKSLCSTLRASACLRSASSTIRSCSCTSRARIRTLLPASRRRPRSSPAGRCRCCMPTMLVDAVAALVFGLLYDKKGRAGARVVDGAVGAVAVFVFACHGVGALLVGVALWGVGMGAQESIPEGRRHADGA